MGAIDIVAASENNAKASKMTAFFEMTTQELEREMVRTQNVIIRAKERRFSYSEKAAKKYLAELRKELRTRPLTKNEVLADLID